MKTLQEIKNEMANRYGYNDYAYMAKSVLDLNDPINDEIAFAFATEALKEASERASMEPDGMALQVNKQSILDIIEELK